MSPIVLIPARLAASRLPGKPLADIAGTSMIVRVMWIAKAANVGPVVIAAGDAEIVEAVEQAGGQAVLTDPALPSGSDRIRAALEIVDPSGRFDAVINLQGDMPLMSPCLVQVCAELLSVETRCDIATLAAPEAGPSDRGDPDVVKAVLALHAGVQTGRALYFTRSRLYGDGEVWRHIGVYGYRREALIRFTDASPSPLEQREKLEQLRALELGLSIWAQIVEAAPISVDTPQDLATARSFAAGMIA